MAAEEIKNIAEEAIENINKITSLINNRTLPPPSQNASKPEITRPFLSISTFSAFVGIISLPFSIIRTSLVTIEYLTGRPARDAEI